MLLVFVCLSALIIKPSFSDKITLW